MSAGVIPGWLWFNGQEVLNNARCLAYVTASNIGKRATIYMSQDGACPEAAVVPNYLPWIGDPGLWSAPYYTTPSTDPAPWLDASRPASPDFLGFWVEEITGLDGTLHERNVTARGSRRGGSSFGRRIDGGRTIGVSMLMLAQNERGMDHGMRWLEDKLLGPLCDPECLQAEVLMRSTCPDESDWNNGLWRLHNVALTSGPSFVQLETTAGCVVQRVEFTITAGDPCRYGGTEDLVLGSPVSLSSSCNLLTRMCGSDISEAVYAVSEAVSIGAKGFRIFIAPSAGQGAPRVTINLAEVEGAVVYTEGNGAEIKRSMEVRPPTGDDILVIDTGRQVIERYVDGDPGERVKAMEYLGYPSGRGVDWPVLYNCNGVLQVVPNGVCLGGDFAVTIQEYLIEGCAGVYAESKPIGGPYGTMTVL